MRIGWKLALVGALCLALLVPLALLDGLVAERQARGQEVAEEIARASAGPQRLVGPLLLVEASRPTEKRRVVERDGHLSAETEQGSEPYVYLVSPQTLAVTADLAVERRGRSLFSVPTYRAGLDLQARFDATVPAPGGVAVTPVRAWLLLGVGDNRGVRSVALTVAGRPVTVEPGARLEWLPQGLHAPVPLAALAGPLDVAVDLSLMGTERLDWLPAGADTTVEVRGDWPHPGFEGHHLPEGRQIDDAGFQASWRISRLASQASRALANCSPAEGRCQAAQEGGFGLRLVDPVDRYLMTERAMKYALLFLVLVFGAVFLVEALAARPVHIVQYGLTGLALAMFYLLLLSLSEHIGFGLAYAIAAAACSGLLAHYLAGVLGGRGRGLGFGLGLAALYGLLFVLLRSEDHALLVGSGVLFAALAAVMVLTRRLDWYRLGGA